MRIGSIPYDQHPRSRALIRGRSLWSSGRVYRSVFYYKTSVRGCPEGQPGENKFIGFLMPVLAYEYVGVPNDLRFRAFMRCRGAQAASRPLKWQLGRPRTRYLCRPGSLVVLEMSRILQNKSTCVQPANVVAIRPRQPAYWSQVKMQPRVMGRLRLHQQITAPVSSSFLNRRLAARKSEIHLQDYWERWALELHRRNHCPLRGIGVSQLSNPKSW